MVAIVPSQPLFPLGQIVATPAALDALQQAGQSPQDFVTRHAHGDWGEVCDEDKALNDESIRDGGRLLSAYRTKLDVKLWIITEATDDQGRRAATTILLPSEY
jgi:hypothetical protein